MAADFLHDFFSHFCHQLPERCLSKGGECLPLCARCTGLYLGAGLVGLWLIGHLFLRRRPWTPRPWLVWALILVGICAIDGLSGASHAWRLGNGPRFLLGYGGGVGAALLMTAFLRRWFPETRGPSFSDRRALGLLPALAIPPMAILSVSGAWLGAGLIYFSVAGLTIYQALLLFSLLELLRRVYGWVLDRVEIKGLFG